MKLRPTGSCRCRSQSTRGRRRPASYGALVSNEWLILLDVCTSCTSTAMPDIVLSWLDAVVAMNYPTLMDPTAPTALGDNNYYTVGQHPYLFWASIGHSPESDGRHQWATPMTFQK